MNNSIAIWTDSLPEFSELHINYWILKKKGLLRDHFLDFGVKLINWEGGKVHFFVPIDHIDRSLFEIGKELNNRELANALFNENCKITTSEGKKIEIQLPNEKLTVFLFDIDNDVQVEKKYSGTHFTIQVPHDKVNWYLRFRIKIPISMALLNLFKYRSWNTIRSSFSKKHTPSGSFYQSVRSSVEAIDFRINDRRSLDYSLLDENQDKFLRLRKLHFFTIYDQDEDLIYHSTRPKKARLLENKVWSNYLQNISGANRKYCANHWSCAPPPDEGWEVFLKTSYASSNILTISWYVLLIGLLGFTINICSSIAFEKFRSTSSFKELFKTEQIKGTSNQ